MVCFYFCFLLLTIHKSCHPLLVVLEEESEELTAEIEHAINHLSEEVIGRILEEDLGTNDCAICKSTVSRGRIIPNCGHTFCRDCIEEYMSVQDVEDEVTVCPLCRGPVDEIS